MSEGEIPYEDHPGFFKFQDDGGEWRWRQRDTGNHAIISTSGEGYETEEGVDRAVANVFEERDADA